MSLDHSLTLKKLRDSLLADAFGVEDRHLEGPSWSSSLMAENPVIETTNE